MASDTVHGGNMLRRVVDYFCHLAVKPDFYPQMVKDRDFENTEFAAKIRWLAKDNEDIYDPDYGDMLRVAFMYSFDRGRLSDLVSLLSGRDFQTREYKDEIVEDSYNKLKSGILNWFVLSTLTGRYVGSSESIMSRDIRNISEKGFLQFAQEAEASALSDTFWRVTLPQNLETTSVNSPAFNTFLAAQDYLKSSSMLMKGTMISDLITISGDVHHIFPKAYLKKNGVDAKGRYNQVANYTYLDTQVNKAISDDAPCRYFGVILDQCKTRDVQIGNITDENELAANLAENAIPSEVVHMDVNDYDRFLSERRKMMAAMIEQYYKSL